MPKLLFFTQKQALREPDMIYKQFQTTVKNWLEMSNVINIVRN